MNTPEPEKHLQLPPLTGSPTVSNHPARSVIFSPCVPRVYGGVNVLGVQPTTGTSSFRSLEEISQLTPRQSPAMVRMSKSSFRQSTKVAPRPPPLSEVEDMFEYDISSLVEDLDKMGTYVSGETLMTHLHRMVMGVVACKESMWEVLKDRLRHKQYAKELRELGWEDEEGAGELQERKQFEKMLEQYQE